MRIVIDEDRTSVGPLPITYQNTSDIKEFRNLLHPVPDRVSSVHGDGAYDGMKNFQYISNR